MEGGGGGEVACAIYQVLVVLCGWAVVVCVVCGWARAGGGWKK
jgi:hypothetical protein